MGTGNEVLMLIGVIWALCFEFMALKQKQIMQLFIFSTIAAIGYIVAGLAAPTAVGAVGGVAEIINFVVMRILIFLTIAYLVSAAKTHDIDKMKGLGKVMPITTTLLAFGIIASMGLSPFKASLSKLLIFHSAVESGAWIVLGIMVLALICQACYFLRLVQKLIFAPYEGDVVKESFSPLLLLAVVFAAAAAYIGYAGEEILHLAEQQVALMRGGEVILPHLESAWPKLVLIPYYGAFVAFLLGRILPGLRNLAVFLITLAPVLYLGFDPAWSIAALGPLHWFFAFFMALMMFLIGLYSIGFMAKEQAQGRFYFWFIYLTAALMGLGISKSLGDFYAFWEMMTVSSYFLALQRETIGARKAALTYFLAAATAGYLFLTAILTVGLGLGSFELAALANVSLQLPVTMIALFFFIGLGIKAELFPLYGWVPKLYQESFAPVSAIFASILSKTAVIGLLGVLFVALGGVKGSPEIMMAFAWVGAITMILGAAALLLQSDMQKLLAYCSITQMGYVIIGISLGSALGVAGGVFHALNHMICKGLLFLCVGAVVLQTGTKDLNQLGGLARRMPVTAFAVLIAAFGIAGIPPLNGFASKWMIYQAAINEGSSAGIILAALTMIASTATLAAFIKLVHSAFFGLAPEKCADVKEVPFIMQLPMLILAGLCILFGFLPQIPLFLIAGIEAQLGITPVDPFNLMSLVQTYNAGWIAFVVIIFGIGLALILGMFGSGKQKIERKVPIYAGGKELEPNNFTAGDIQIGANNFYPSVEFLLEQFFQAWSFLGAIFAPIGKIFNAGETENVERRESNVSGSIRETL